MVRSAPDERGSMRAIVFHRHGGPEVLEPAELPDPEPGPTEVRVRVKAVALNHLDLWVRKGWDGLKLELPHVGGADVTGVIDAVGARVKGWQVGQRVAVQPGVSCMQCEACLTGRDNLCGRYDIVGEHRAGGLAELLVVPHHNVLPLPDALSFEQGAAVPLVFLTAWEMLHVRARVQAGETVLVHAAGSGVGSAGLQVAKLLGARVIVTAGSHEKLAKAKALGADETIHYGEQDFVAEVRRLTGRAGVDVVFDHVGALTWDGSVRVLRNGGRLVTCGATTGHDVKVDLRHLFYRRLSLLGSTMGSKGTLPQLFRLVAAGRLRPVVDRVLPLAQAREAHELVASRALFGKVVLTP